MPEAIAKAEFCEQGNDNTKEKYINMKAKFKTSVYKQSMNPSH
jgi:hypothetical protein